MQKTERALKLNFPGHFFFLSEMKQDRRRQHFDEIKNRGVHRWRVLFSAADRWGR